MDTKYTQMETYTLGATRITRSMERVFSIGSVCKALVLNIIREAGGLDYHQAEESTNALTVSLEMIQVTFIRDSSRTGSSTARVLKNLLMVTHIQVFM